MSTALEKQLSALVRNDGGDGKTWSAIDPPSPAEEVARYKDRTEQGYPKIALDTLALYQKFGVDVANLHRTPQCKSCAEAIAARAATLRKPIAYPQEIKTVVYRDGETLGIFNMLASDDLPKMSDTPVSSVVESMGKSRPRPFADDDIDFRRLAPITGMKTFNRLKFDDDSLIAGRFDPLSFIARLGNGELEKYGIKKIVNVIDRSILQQTKPLYATLGSGTWGAEFPQPKQFASLANCKNDAVTVKVEEFAVRTIRPPKGYRRRVIRPYDIHTEPDFYKIDETPPRK